MAGMNYLTPPPLGISFAMIGLALTPSLRADTLVEYSFVTSATAATVTGANVTPSAFGKGAGITTSMTGMLSSTTGNPAKSLFITGDQIDEAASATSTDYLTFTVTAGGSNKLNLSALSFDYAYSFTGAGTTTANVATYDVRSSVDNYASSIATFTANAQSTGTNPVWSPASVGLTAAAYQDLSSITFRIMLADDGSTSATSFLRFDSVVLSGVVTAIPEPSTYALFAGAGGLALAAIRRRGRR